MAEPISGLGKGGLNMDLPPMIVPPNTFTDGYNIRFDDESVQTITGETTYKVVSIAPDFGIHWRRPDQGYNIFAKNGNIVRIDAAGNSSSMFSSTATEYNNSDWQGTLFNGGYAIVLNNGTSTPLYCLYGSSTAGSSFQPLPNWNYISGLTVTAKVIRSLGYSLVAANLTLTQGGVTTYAPGTIRISVQASTGNIPQVWQPGLTTDTADEFELSSTSPILDMAELRGNLFVYSSDSISMVSLGGATTRVSPYSKSYGILNTDCVVEYDGNHFVVDRNDIYIHNGSGQIKSIADWRIKKYFFGELNKAALNKVHVTKHPFYKEIWINFPEGSSTVCNEALIYNYRNDTWSKRVLPSLTYSFAGPENVSNAFQYSKEVVYMCTNTTQTLVTNDGYQMWNGTALTSFTSYIEKLKMNTGDITGSSLISSLYPIFDKVPTDANITIRVRGQNNYTDYVDLSTDDPNLKDTFVFKPDEQKSQGYKVDPRINGRVLNYRITSEGYWRLALIGVDAKQADRR
jgi:hypothetical protein